MCGCYDLWYLLRADKPVCCVGISLSLLLLCVHTGMAPVSLLGTAIAAMMCRFRFYQVSVCWLWV